MKLIVVLVNQLSISYVEGKGSGSVDDLHRGPTGKALSVNIKSIPSSPITFTVQKL